MEKIHRIRSIREGSTKRVCRKRGMSLEEGQRKVAEKVALIPCEEKSNSLIFID